MIALKPIRMSLSLRAIVAAISLHISWYLATKHLSNADTSSVLWDYFMPGHYHLIGIPEIDLILKSLFNYCKVVEALVIILVPTLVGLVFFEISFKLVGWLAPAFAAAVARLFDFIAWWRYAVPEFTAPTVRVLPTTLLKVELIDGVPSYYVELPELGVAKVELSCAVMPFLRCSLHDKIGVDSKGTMAEMAVANSTKFITPKHPPTLLMLSRPGDGVPDSFVGLASYIVLENKHLMLTAAHVYLAFQDSDNIALTSHLGPDCRMLLPKSDTCLHYLDIGADIVAFAVNSKVFSALQVKSTRIAARFTPHATIYSVDPTTGKWTYSRGTVNIGPDYGCLKHSITTRPGTSGSPLLTTTGSLIGVHCGALLDESLNYGAMFTAKHLSQLQEVTPADEYLNNLRSQELYYDFSIPEMSGDWDYSVQEDDYNYAKDHYGDFSWEDLDERRIIRGNKVMSVYFSPAERNYYKGKTGHINLDDYADDWVLTVDEQATRDLQAQRSANRKNYPRKTRERPWEEENYVVSFTPSPITPDDASSSDLNLRGCLTKSTKTPHHFAVSGKSTKPPVFNYYRDRESALTSLYQRWGLQRSNPLDIPPPPPTSLPEQSSSSLDLPSTDGLTHMPELNESPCSINQDDSNMLILPTQCLNSSSELIESFGIVTERQLQSQKDLETSLSECTLGPELSWPEQPAFTFPCPSTTQETSNLPPLPGMSELVATYVAAKPRNQRLDLVTRLLLFRTTADAQEFLTSRGLAYHHSTRRRQRKSRPSQTRSPLLPTPTAPSCVCSQLRQASMRSTNTGSSQTPAPESRGRRSNRRPKRSSRNTQGSLPSASVEEPAIMQVSTSPTSTQSS